MGSATATAANGSRPSTVQPSFSDVDSRDEVYQTGDGYRWKYLASTSDTDLARFGVTGWFPVVANSEVAALSSPGTIDVCLVASRDEGGPRAVLESMATRVPLVTTRVGQAADLVRHGENGWLVEAEDVDGLVACTAHVAEATAAELEPVLAAGRATAEANSYDALRPRWRALLDGFVSLPEA